MSDMIDALQMAIESMPRFRIGCDMGEGVDCSVEYTYRGDRLTSVELRGAKCKAVRRNGKCIRGKNSNMLVQFETGQRAVILARQLRKLK